MRPSDDCQQAALLMPGSPPDLELLPWLQKLSHSDAQEPGTGTLGAC